MKSKKRPLLLDLFCSAGGAGMGFYEAGFDVVGCDIEPQPNYPFAFIQMDAISLLTRLISGAWMTDSKLRNWRLEDFAMIHASPPCQKYSGMTKGMWKDRIDSHPDLIAPVRELLIKTGLPYDIENVEGARKEMINPILLCGTMFGLRTSHGSQLRRHRYFELSIPFFLTPSCQHNKEAGSTIRVYGGGQDGKRRRPASVGVYGHSGGGSKRDGTASFGVHDRKVAMGIDWMTNEELSEAIPPAYTKYLGEMFLKKINHSM